MSAQASLFETAPPALREVGRSRRRDPDTSKAAARSTPVAELEGRVLEALRNHPRGLTSHEMAKLLAVDLVSVSPRFRPLAEKFLVIPTAERRAGPSGRKSIVWKAR